MLRIPWNYETDSIEMIVLSHVLEHVRLIEARRVIPEAKRVLMPGGTIHIAVPDMDLFIHAMLDDNQFLLEKFPYKSLDSLLGGGEKEPHPEMRHRYMYCYGSLWYELTLAGFGDIHPMPFSEYDTPTTRGWALQVEATA